MSTNNAIFLEVIEWLDQTGQEVVHRVPGEGSGEIKLGAQLIVRESQAAVFFYNGKAYDAFGPGRHTLTTANIPILTKILSMPWGMTSPLRAEVYFVNTRIFPNLKWGTRDPVAFKDSQLGLIRLRAFGVFNIRVTQPVLMVNSLVGTLPVYTVEGLEDYLSRVIVSRLNDYLGEHLDTVLNLPGKYDSIADGLTKQLEQDFSNYGLALSALYVTSITPPLEVQKAIDDKSKLGVFDDLNRLLKMKAAMAMEKAADSGGQAGAGVGMGMAFMMPNIFRDAFRDGTPTPPTASQSCPDCKQEIPGDSRFCPQCGHQVVVLNRCSACGKNLPPHCRFCPRCGKAVAAKSEPKLCKHCHTSNLPESVYCNNCGEKL
jgi:membrane protease subunit (stomatin/prohibitin family)